MNNFKVCKNGHHYQDSYSECPYCPQPQQAGAVQPAAVANEKTRIFQQPATAVEDNEKTQIMQGPVPTFPQEGAVATGNAASGNAAPIPQVGRKFVAWLVTYDNYPNGRDYKLYEGRNAVGYSKDCEVCVDFDSLVSSRHLTILYRLGEFLFKDELSTNGTFINGKLSNEGPLNDGDKIKVGNTTFLFRSAVG